MRPRWFHFPSVPPESPEPPVPDYIHPGDYTVVVESIEEKVSQWDNPYYHLTCVVVSLDRSIHKDFRLHFVLSTALTSLWCMRAFILAATGQDVRGTQYQFDPSKFRGACFGVRVATEEFAGKTRNRVRGFLTWEGELIDD